MEKMPKIITLKNVTKVFDDTVVVDKINFYIRKGEFVTILGPSGCGKTTTLRMIAGFETPTSGDILLNDIDITSIPPYKRPVNTVFQRYALFPHLDVYENVAFGLKLKKIPVLNKDKSGKPILKINKAKIKDLKAQVKRLEKDKLISEEEKNSRITALNTRIEDLYSNPEQSYKYKKFSEKEIDEKVLKALTIVDLDELEDRDISTLSGGQQQRVAIARAICNEPEILLLDEPLGALDLKMRKDMQLELKEMHKKLGITFIYVTHDQEEALTMSDTIVVINDGEIQQVGTPKGIYDEPKNAFVADFIGESNIYTGTMYPNHKVRFLGKLFSCVDDFPANQKVDVVVRPEDVNILSKGRGTVDGIVTNKIFKGIHYEYTIMIGKNELIAQSTKEISDKKEVSISIEPDNIQIMAKPFTSNFYDGYLTSDYKVNFAGVDFECDILSLFPKSHFNEDGVLVDEKNNPIDVEDKEVTIEVPFDGISISDNPEDGQVIGKIFSMIYLGDHYQVTVRTEDEEDFVLDTPYLWNENDEVSVKIEPKYIHMKLKMGDKKHA